uniref:Uncharacterized protein n=1 Tax=Magallana gigas TaxID=29159 RepID=A0A8W8IHW4_MAGGI
MCCLESCCITGLVSIYSKARASSIEDREKEKSKRETSESKTVAPPLKEEEKNDIDEEENSDDNLSLEEISSEEGSVIGEEEKKPSIMDIVDIDWTSLVQSSQPKPASTGSALQRFRAPAIFASLGVSKEFAGEKLFKKIQSSCQQELEAQREKDSETPSKLVVYELQDSLKKVQTERSTAFSSKKDILAKIGNFRRALCARKDIEIRRKLCRVDTNLDQSFNPPIPDQELCKLSAQLLSQCSDVFPVKKEETTPPAIKPEIQCA